jgi:hypothetical protein
MWLLFVFFCYNVSSFAFSPALMATGVPISMLMMSNSANEQESLQNVGAPKIIGAMVCNIKYKNIPDFNYDVIGCRGYGETLSINDFFEKYRRNKDYQILNIIYNEYKNHFVIYYGMKG